MRLLSRSTRFAISGAVMLSLAGGALASQQLAGQPVQRLSAEEYPREQRLAELHAILAHEDHSIDILNAEKGEPREHRKLLVEHLQHVRDAVQRIIDEMEHRGGERDVREDHRRDEEVKHEERPATYFGGLVRVQEYIKNDTIVLTRHPADPNHHRGNALEALEKANKEIHQEMEEYQHIHPGSR